MLARFSIDGPESKHVHRSHRPRREHVSALCVCHAAHAFQQEEWEAEEWAEKPSEDRGGAIELALALSATLGDPTSRAFVDCLVESPLALQAHGKLP